MLIINFIFSKFLLLRIFINYLKTIIIVESFLKYIKKNRFNQINSLVFIVRI